LSQIPILKWLFGQTNTDHSENEIVFVLIPHIVRGPDITQINQEALDVGTASAIAMRRVSHSTSAAEKPPAPPAQTSPSPAPTAPPAQNAPASNPGASAMPQATPAMSPAGQAGAASFAFDPPSSTQKAGSTFAVNVVLNAAQNAYSVPLQLTYDPKVLQVVNVSNGNFLSQDGQAVAVVHRDDDSTGTLQVTATRPPGASGVSGQGTVVTLTFMAKTSGQSVLVIGKGGVRDPGMQAIPVAGASSVITVQ
jgi:general secretion pathway protein D